MTDHDAMQDQLSAASIAVDLLRDENAALLADRDRLDAEVKRLTAVIEDLHRGYNERANNASREYVARIRELGAEVTRLQKRIASMCPSFTPDQSRLWCGRCGFIEALHTPAAENGATT